jgi:hypothetical protein
VAALAAVAAVLEIVAPAGARSPVNQAPIAAERSKSVRFSATQEITVGGRPVTNVTETGQLDFETGAFATTLIVGEGHGRIERRRIGRTLYFKYVSADPRRRRHDRWIAIRVSPNSLRSFSPPGGYTLIDPQVIFRVMADSRSPVTRVGRGRVHGVEATQYRLSTSFKAFLAAEQGHSLANSHGSGGMTTLDVWLDARGRPVRVRGTLLSMSEHAKMTTGVDFAGYGEPVTVRPPPPTSIGSRAIQGLPSTLGDPARAAERLFGLVQ